MKKLYLRFYLLFVVLFATVCLNAQVVVTAPSLTIPACSGFPTGVFTLGDIVITETNADDISAGGDFELTLPANFTFGGAGSVFTSGGGVDVTSVAFTSTSITIKLDVTSTSTKNTITIHGLTIIAINGPSGPGNILRTATGTDAVILGDNPGGTVSHGVLTSTAGTPPTIGTGPAGATYCLNDPATALTVSASGAGPFTYQWYSNTVNNNTSGTAISGGTNSSYTPPTTPTGTTYYYVKVAGSCGTTISNTAEIDVNSLPAPTFTTGPAATMCANTITTYTTQSANANYVWSVPGVSGTDYVITGGGTGNTNNFVTIQWLSTGSKTVTVNYKNGFGCFGANPATNTTMVTPGTPAKPGPVSGGATICDNSSGNAYSIGTVTGATGYTWSYSGAGATITGNGTNSITIDFAAGATSGTLSVTADNGCGSSSASTQAITVLPSPVGGSVLSSASFCSGGSGTLAVTGQTGNVLRWEFSTDGGTTWSTIANTTVNQNYTNITAPVQYRAVIGNACGNATSAAASLTIHDYWVGTTSSDWNVGSNWSDGLVPPSGGCATYYIPAGVPHSPQLTSNVSVPDITMASGTTLDLNGNTLTITGAYNGPGTFTGSKASRLIITGNAGTLHFTPNVYPGAVNNNYLHALIVNGSGSATLGDSLNVGGGTTGNYGTVISTGGLNANGNLTLKSDANGTAIVAASTGSITGEVTVERYIPPRRAWRFVAVPFSSSSQMMRDAWQEGVNNTDPTLNYANNQNPHPGFGTHITGNNITSLGYDYNTTTNPSVKVWDPSINTWNAIEPATNATNIAAYDAYCLFVRGSRAVNLALAASAPSDPTVLRIKGILNQAGGNVTRSLPLVYSGEFLFIGNPYAAPIDLTAVFSRFNASTNIASNKFWVWNPSDPGTFNTGGYVTWDHGVTTPAGDTYAGGTIIQSGQAFMLQAINNGTVSYDFQEGDKVATETNVFGKVAGPPYPLVYVNLTIPQPGTHIIIDGVATGFGKKFSASVDVDDAEKQWNFDENIATIRDGIPLAIEFRPLPKLMDTLFYRMYLRQEPYSLQIFSNNFETVPVRAWLVDKYLNTKTEINLLDTTYYDFTPNPDTNSYRNRFMIVFNRQFTGTPVPVTKAINQASPNTTGVANSIAVKTTGVVMYPNPANTNKVTLEFNNMDKGKYEITVYSPEGQKLASRKIEHNGGNNIYPLPLNPSWAAGIYTVSIAGDDSKKVIDLRLIIGK